MRGTILITITLAAVALTTALQYTARLQTELDSVDLDQYLKNERLFNLQRKCMFDEGPCDIVGRWIKPRIAKALQGECYLCTEVQAKKVAKVMKDMEAQRPEVHKALLVKYIDNAKQ